MKAKRIISLLMSVLMIISCFPAAAAQAIGAKITMPDKVVTNDSDYNIAPGIVEKRITTIAPDGSNQTQSYAAIVDLKDKNIGILAGYDDYSKSNNWNLTTVRDQAMAAEKATGKNIVVALNADYFNMQTGEPWGALVMGGVKVHDTYWDPGSQNGYMAILKDGTIELRDGYVPIDDNVQEAIGSPIRLIRDGQNIHGKENTDIMPRAAIGVTADGKVVFFESDGRQAPKSVGYTLYETAEMMLALGCVDALYLDGGGSATFCTKSEGTDELTVKNSPSDGMERRVSSSVFVYTDAKPTGEFDHASVLPTNTIYTPGSVIDFEAIGVDSAGGKAELPSGGRFVLDASCEAMGTITDDGVFTAGTQTGTVTVNYVLNGNVCGSAVIEIQVPDELYIPSSDVSIPFEETTDFGIEAQYQNRPVIMKSGDINWQMTATDSQNNDFSDKAGRFEGLNFIATDAEIANKEPVNAVVTATNAFNAGISVQINVLIGAHPKTMYDFEYTDSKEEAEGNSGLKYIPSYKMPRFDRNLYHTNPDGSPVLNENGQPVAVTSTEQAAMFYEQGYPLYCWPNASLTDQDSMKATVVSKDDGAPVRSGNKSLRIDYDYSSYNGSKNSNNYLRVTDPNYTFTGSPSAIGAWVYVPEGTANFHLYLNCGNRVTPDSGTYAFGCVTDKVGINWTGWKYVEFDLTDTKNSGAGLQNAPFGMYQGCGIFWISYQTGTKNGDRTASTLYLDDIQLIYGENISDTANPEVKTIRTESNIGPELEDGKTVLTSNTNTFVASYADADTKYATGIDYSSVKMSIDGVDVSDKCAVNEGDGEVYLYDAELANGNHHIEISVADNNGNVATETRYFTVKGDSETTSVSFEPLDEYPVLGDKYTIAVKSKNALNVKNAEISVKLLSNFLKYWDKFTVVPGDNYVLDGEATYDEIYRNINFSVSKKDGAAAANDDIVAKIVFDVPTNVPEGLGVTFRIAKGALTLEDVTGKDFISGFSGKFEATCQSPYVLTIDTMVVGSEGGYIHINKRDDGTPVEGMNVYAVGLADGGTDLLLGVTDAEGKLFVNNFVYATTAFSIYANKVVDHGSYTEELFRTFEKKSQSFPAGGDESGAPTFVKFNAVNDPSSSKNISWMSSPLKSADKAVVKYAAKADYEAKGEEALKTVDANSVLKEMSSTPDINTNYAVRINNAVLTGLDADTEYVYTVGDGEKMTEIKTFETSRKGEAVNFFVIGDTQAEETTNTDRISQNLASSGVDYSFGIQTGDSVDNGGNYKMWENIAKIFSGNFMGDKDLVQVLGNHEYYGDETASNASAYYNLPGTKDSVAPPYYSVQYGNVYVAVINYSNLSGYEKAAKWLVEDAKASKANWKILTMHQAPYFTNPSGTNADFTDIMTPAIDEAGINVVFSGHDHSYARTEPMKNGAVEKDGTTYYICGSTGEKSYEIVKNPRAEYAKLEKDYNAIYLTVNADDTKLEIVTHDVKENGEDVVIDSCTLTRDVNCKDKHHDYILENDYLTCSVCGYTTPLSGYTGLAVNPENGKLMYFILGEMKKGWIPYNNENYYFDENGFAATGTVEIDGKDYTFDKDGKYLHGSFVTEKVTLADGTEKEVIRYYVAGGSFFIRWLKIDGDWYFFKKSGNNVNPDDGDMFRGGRRKVNLPGSANDAYYTFADDGKLSMGALFDVAVGDKNYVRYYWGPDYVREATKIAGVTVDFDKETGYMLPKDMSECSVSLGSSSFEYTSKAVKPTVTVKCGDETLVKGTHYTVEYKDNVKPGQASIVVKGKTGFTGEVTVPFTIEKRSASGFTVSAIANQTYTGKAITPTVTVKSGSLKLKKDKDYTVSYKNNTKAGTASVTITGTGDNYTGKKTVTFKIVKRDISKLKFASISNQTYTGKSIKPTVKVTTSGLNLKLGTDYTVSYQSNISAGTAKITITGKGSCTGKKTITFKIVKRDISKLKFVAVPNQSYTGKAIKPIVKVATSGMNLKQGTNFTATYKKNTAIGKATITITGKGSCTGTKTITFNIVPKKVSSLKDSSSTYNKIKLSWKKVTGATAYQVYRATSKNGKYTRVDTVKGTSCTVSASLGKTYYFKVRAYTKTGGKTYYGDFSSICTAKSALGKVATVKVQSASNAATVTWTAVSGASGYEVWAKTKGASKYKKVKTVSNSTRKFVEKKLKKSSKRYYKVRAYKTVSGKKIYGSFSTTRSVTVR